MQEILQKSVLARGDQDWLFGGGMCGIYLEGKGQQYAQHRGPWRDPAPSTLLEIQLETNNSGK